MKRRKQCGNEKGTSMVFAMMLFLVLLVLGINLANAVYANTVNVNSEVEKEQKLLYLSSVFDVVNRMISEGSFYDAKAGKMAANAGTVIQTRSQNITVDIIFREKNSSLSAEITMNYQGQTYQISCVYQKTGTGGAYSLQRCSGLEGTP